MKAIFKSHSTNDTFIHDQTTQLFKLKPALLCESEAIKLAKENNGFFVKMKNTQQGNLWVVFSESGSSIGSFYVQ